MTLDAPKIRATFEVKFGTLNLKDEVWSCMNMAVSERSRIKCWTIAGKSYPPLSTTNDVRSSERLGSSTYFLMYNR